MPESVPPQPDDTSRPLLRLVIPEAELTEWQHFVRTGVDLRPFLPRIVVRPEAE